MSERQVVFLDHCALLSGAELALLNVLPYVQGDCRVVLAAHGPLEDRLRTNGHRVSILPMDPEVASLRRDRITPTRLPFRSAWATLAYSVRLAGTLRAARVDLVHTNSLKSAVYGGIAGRLAGIPVVWHLRDRIAPDYLPRPAVWGIRLLALALPQAIIANSQATLKTLGARRTASSERYFVVPSPVRQFRRMDRNPDADSHVVVIGMVGRLAPWKGQDIFLKAFARVVQGRPVRARIIGSALFGEEEYAASLEALVDQLGIGDHVDFVGFRDDMTSEYQDMDILVHASIIPEPFGQVIIEGMAAGAAVIAAAAGGPLEIVAHGVDGLLTKPGDVADLAATINSLISDSVLRERLGTNGRLKAALYRPELIGARITAVHAQVMARYDGKRGRRARKS